MKLISEALEREDESTYRVVYPLRTVRYLFESGRVVDVIECAHVDVRGALLDVTGESKIVGTAYVGAAYIEANGSDCCNRNSPDENHAPGCYNAPATFRCECGFRVAGATEYEVEWIGTGHRAVIHGDERDSDDE